VSKINQIQPNLPSCKKVCGLKKAMLNNMKVAVSNKCDGKNFNNKRSSKLGIVITKKILPLTYHQSITAISWLPPLTSYIFHHGFLAHFL